MEKNTFLQTHKWKLIGTILGAIGGYLYWSKIGCMTGTCPLKSQWQTIVPYGAILGYTISGIVSDMIKNKP